MSASRGSRARGAARTVATLALLQSALPLNLALTGAALLRSGVRAPSRSSRPAADRARTVLVSGGKMTKSLALARAFHAAGHRVVLVESPRYRLTGHRFSRAVAAFHTVPEPDDPTYADALLAIVLAEGVDVYVPVSSPASSIADAQVGELLAPHCDVVHGDVASIVAVDDKATFAELATSLGLPVPVSHRLTAPEQVAALDLTGTHDGFVLKSIPYDPVHRLDLTRLPLESPALTEQFVRERDVSPHRPSVLQEFVSGREYCTHGTARDGRLRVYCCCESSAWQLNYAAVDHPAIEAWVTRFVEEQGLTGQFSFDFIETADGDLRAIECNPRTHSAITLFDGHPGLAAGYLEPAGDPSTDDVVRPSEAARPTYWTYHEVWRLLTHPGTFRERLRVLVTGRDAIFDWDDPLPFLLVHHLQIPALLVQSLRRGVPWVRIDFNIGKLVSPAGD